MKRVLAHVEHKPAVSLQFTFSLLSQQKIIPVRHEPTDVDQHFSCFNDIFLFVSQYLRWSIACFDADQLFRSMIVVVEVVLHI